MEGFVRVLQGLPRTRVNDGVSSMAAGLMMFMVDEVSPSLSP